MIVEFHTPTGISVSNARLDVEQIHLESASAHVAWYDAATPNGNRTYMLLVK